MQVRWCHRVVSVILRTHYRFCHISSSCVMLAASAASPSPPPLAPSPSDRMAALTFALAHVIFAAASDTRAAVVVLHQPPSEDSAHACSVLTPAAHFTVRTLSVFDDVLAYVGAHLPVFATPAGVMCLVYSALLSRGIEAVSVSALHRFL